jgi:hypothetical protein
MTTTARDIMTPNVECVVESVTLVDAARKMRVLTSVCYRYAGPVTGSREVGRG